MTDTTDATEAFRRLGEALRLQGQELQAFAEGRRAQPDTDEGLVAEMRHEVEGGEHR